MAVVVEVDFVVIAVGRGWDEHSSVLPYSSLLVRGSESETSD